MQTIEPLETFKSPLWVYENIVEDQANGKHCNRINNNQRILKEKLTGKMEGLGRTLTVLAEIASMATNVNRQMMGRIRGVRMASFRNGNS
jgi:hypothetical protein